MLVEVILFIAPLTIGIEATGGHQPLTHAAFATSNCIRKRKTC